MFGEYGGVVAEYHVPVSDPGRSCRWMSLAAAVFVQLGMNMWLLHREFRVRLRFDSAPA